MAEITRIMLGRLQELLEYNPSTGEFFWKVSFNNVKTGDRAGSVYTNGYRYIQVDGQDYRAGRLAWFFVTGEDPDVFVDHKNQVRDDNRFINLRLATNSQNQANAFWRTNTSGIKGVCWQQSRQKWIAQITVDGKRRNLGRFDSILEAAYVYKAAALEAWGEHARVASDEEIEAIARRH